MGSAYIIYHIARADFLERVRRYSFLVMLGLVVFLGYQTAIGNIALGLGAYRGEFNSAWVGAMMSLIATFFLGWFGFYLIKGSVARDQETGVGQIMATTPLTRPQYMIGKWISNFTVLMSMVLILALTGILIQLLQGESASFEFFAFIAPFLFIVTPLIAVVSAATVLFEAIPFLSGGFGNIVYFFAYIMTMPLFMENDTISRYPAFEPLGLGLLSTEMGSAIRAIHPDYDGSFTLGAGMIESTTTFLWTGIHWTLDILFARFTLILLAFGYILLAALFFDRFDPSRTKPSKRKKSSSLPTIESAPALQTSHAIQLTPLNRAANRFGFFRILLAELKLMLKGQRWWWYLIALGFVIAGFSNEAAVARQILPAAWLWHILLISPLGSREARDNVQQLAFSSAVPLWRQLPAQWLAGFIVTLGMSLGVLLRLLMVNDAEGLLALFSGLLFIPSLALAFGVWSGTSKVFEVVYVTLWYLLLNKVPQVDFTGFTTHGNPEFFIPFSIILIITAFIGRARQLQG